MSVTVIEYVLGRLHDIGVRDIFGVPGDYAFPLHDAIVAHPDINWIGCCNELNAGYAADGYARIRGVGAISTTYGVGELSAISAVAGSYAENVPIFHLTGTPTLATQANRALVHHTLGNGEFELFRSMADTVVGASAIITPANTVAETERLIAEALYNRRPVYMALPSDVVNQPVVARSDPLPLPVSDPIALGTATDAVVGAVESASAACVLPGMLLDRLGLRDTVRQFVDAAALPFATMFADKSVLGEDDPNYVGMYDGNLMNPAVREFVETCDVVVTIGTMATDLNTGAFTSNLDPDRIVEIGLHHTRVGSTVHQGVEMAELLHALTERSWTPRHRGGPRPDQLGPVTGSGDDPITAEALYPRWADFLQPEDIIIAETGTCSMGLAFAQLPRGARFHNQTLWGAIGWATPAALGAAVAAPNRRLILFTGEGSHQMTAQEVSQFHRLGLKPIIFVLNNSGYLIERMLCADPAVSYNDVVLWRYAELPHALGCVDWFTSRVSTCAELDTALGVAGDGNRNRATYIEVMTGTYEVPPLVQKLHDNLKTLYGTG